MSSTGDEKHYQGGSASSSEAAPDEIPLRERLAINALAMLCLGTTLAWLTFLAWLFGWLVGLW
jgi:hypothetical protein